MGGAKEIDLSFGTLFREELESIMPPLNSHEEKLAENGDKAMVDLSFGTLVQEECCGFHGTEGEKAKPNDINSNEWKKSVIELYKTRKSASNIKSLVDDDSEFRSKSCIKKSCTSIPPAAQQTGKKIWMNLKKNPTIQKLNCGNNKNGPALEKLNCASNKKALYLNNYPEEVFVKG